MASLLEALIFDRGHATTELPTGLEVVELNAGLTMLPLTSKQLTRLIGSNSDERIRSNWVLRTDVARLAAHMSAGRHALYVFGESFGPGTQEAMGWFDRQPIYGPVGTCDLEIDREPGYLVVPRADSAEAPEEWTEREPGRPVEEEMAGGPRAEERRVGKECRSRWSPYH